MTATRSLRARLCALALCLVAAIVACGAREARAQGIFDLFGDDPPRARRAAPAPAAPAPERKQKPAAAKAKKTDAAKRHDPAAAAKGAPGAPGGEAPPPPYEPQMTRLTEILGALSFLRDLCGDGDGEEWRGKMSTLLNAEAPSGARRQKLTAAFNRGFRGYELTYRACTPNARLVISRYLDEASRLSREIAYRYGNP